MGDCIACNLCVPVCPNRAIAELEDADGRPMWLVNSDLCSECKDEPGDFYGTNQCVDVCPTLCIVPDDDHEETTVEQKTRGKTLGDFRESMGLPRNYAYAANQDLEPARGEFGPNPFKKS